MTLRRERSTLEEKEEERPFLVSMSQCDDSQEFREEDTISVTTTAIGNNHNHNHISNHENTANDTTNNQTSNTPHPPQQTQHHNTPQHPDNTHSDSIVQPKILRILYPILLLGFMYLTLTVQNPRRCDGTRLPPSTHLGATVDLLPSPAKTSHAIQHELRNFPVQINASQNPFAGPPRPALEHAWHDLLADTIITATGPELAAVNLTSLELADDSDRFVVVPAVAHQLHCLKRIRRWTYFDHYHADASESQVREMRAHVDHCIEMLRLAVLCYADMAFSTFEWLDVDDGQGAKKKVPTARDVGVHQCVKWDPLRKWMVDRSVDIATPGLLKSPVEDRDGDGES